MDFLDDRLALMKQDHRFLVRANMTVLDLMVYPGFFVKIGKFTLQKQLCRIADETRGSSTQSSQFEQNFKPYVSYSR